MAEQQRQGIIGINMTNFFHRDLNMYSIGDIQFKKPIPLKLVGWTMGWLIVWSLPLLFLTGFSLNPFMLVLIFVPPIVAGQLSVKPIFEGKTLVDFTKTMAKFSTLPKGWTDLNSNSNMGEDSYFVESEIWISRRRELQLLRDIQEERYTTQRLKKK